MADVVFAWTAHAHSINLIAILNIIDKVHDATIVVFYIILTASPVIMVWKNFL